MLKNVCKEEMKIDSTMLRAKNLQEIIEVLHGMNFNLITENGSIEASIFVLGERIEKRN